MSDEITAVRYASLVRRLLAIVYDCFLLLGLLFIATAVLMTLNKGEAIEPGSQLYPFYIIYLLAIGFGFFGWFWTHGGQTLGMKTWKIRLQQQDGKAVSWSLALIRYCTAIISWAALGMGFIWSVFDRQKRGWHDIASNTVLIDLRD